MCATQLVLGITVPDTSWLCSSSQCHVYLGRYPVDISLHYICISNYDECWYTIIISILSTMILHLTVMLYEIVVVIHV